MSIYKKLKSLNLPEDAMVSLRFSEGTDVFVHNETEVETALADTDVVSRFSELIATRGLNAQTRWGNNIIGEIREQGMLDDYERDDTFSDFISEMMHDNFYDFDFIEASTEKYDHKRGFCTLSAEIEVPLMNLVTTQPDLYGWDVVVETPLGSLTVDA
tara:strand:- start:168 stop:641 length:474 start_codon:yes stop_codon:yes gene_type:complete